MRGRFVINGAVREIEFDPASTLLATLRAAGCTEVKKGCSEGQCGSCVVLLDGRLVYSCQVFAASAVGHEILTVRGLGELHRPHPIQQALAEAGGVQCGFCTPGKVLAAYALLKENPLATEAEIREALRGVLCRCTGYVKIVDGVKDARDRMGSA